jgi:hypothetical protein
MYDLLGLLCAVYMRAEHQERLKEWMGGGGTMETQSDVWVQASVFDLKPAKPKKDIIRPLGGTTYYPDGDGEYSA